jgi:hypothetical protein
VAGGSAIAKILQSGDENLAAAAISAARAIPPAELSTTGLDKALVSLADGGESPELRMAALATLAAGGGKLTSPQFALLVSGLTADSLSARAAAAEALSQAALTAEQFETLAAAIKSAAPLELNRLLTAFERCADEKTAGKLLSSLRDSPALAAVRVDLLRQALAHCGPMVQKQVDELESLVNVDAAG